MCPIFLDISSIFCTRKPISKFLLNQHWQNCTLKSGIEMRWLEKQLKANKRGGGRGVVINEAGEIKTVYRKVPLKNINARYSIYYSCRVTKRFISNNLAKSKK